VLLAGWNNFRGMVAGFEVVSFISPSSTSEEITEEPEININRSENK
jgi:hypothetical protein